MNSPDNLDDLLELLDNPAQSNPGLEWDSHDLWNRNSANEKRMIMAAQAIRSLREQRWVKVENPPDPDKSQEYIVCAETDDGRIVTTMEYTAGVWVFRGEPTYCHSYYIEPILYQPLPSPPGGCKKCGGTMKPGKAMQSTFTGIGDFRDDDPPVTVSPGGPGKLIDCLKCEDCGWSRQPERGE